MARIEGTAGNDWLSGGEEDDTLIGGDGDDDLFGETGQDLLVGGPGDDRLQGGARSDSYLFNRGDGRDTIEGYSADLVFVSSYAGSLSSGDEVIDTQPVFGATLVDRHVLAGLVGGTEYRVVVGGAFGATLKVLDQLGNVVGTDIGYYDASSGRGFLELQFVAAEGDVYQLLVGGAGDAGGSYEVMVTYREDNRDVLRFGDGIALEDLQVSRPLNDHEDAVVTLSGTPDAIYLHDQFLGEGFGIEEIHLADGTVLTAGDIAALATRPTDNADYLEGSAVGDSLFGHAGGDTLRGMSSNDVLAGNEGDDLLYGDEGRESIFTHGNPGRDTLSGGAGNDTLEGGPDSDTYVFNRGDGQDWIIDSGLFVVIPEYHEGVLQDGDEVADLQPFANATKVDRLALAATLAGTEYLVSVQGDFDTTLKIVDQYGDVIVEADGSLSVEDDGSLSGETSVSFTAAEGARYDALIGGANDPAGYYSLSVWYLAENHDVIRFGDGIVFSDLQVSVVGTHDEDLLISVAGTTDSILISSQLSQSGVEELRFTDGTVISSATFGSLVNRATHYGDRLMGDDADNTMAGHAGDDTMDGGAGNDLISGEAGNDVLGDVVGVNTLRGGAGDDTIMGSAGDHARGNGGADLIQGVGCASGGRGDDRVVGFGGNDLLNGDEGADTLGGWAGNDLLTGGSGSDRLWGGVSSDTLHGGRGIDSLYGGEGDDRLAGGAGMDFLNGGAGADVFVIRDALRPDIVQDFSQAEGDHLQLNAIAFEGIRAGALADKRLVTGVAATDAVQRFVFDSNSGDLYYDADGSGAAEQVLIASFSNGILLAASDIVIV